MRYIRLYEKIKACPDERLQSIARGAPARFTIGNRGAGRPNKQQLKLSLLVVEGLLGA